MNEYFPVKTETCWNQWEISHPQRLKYNYHSKKYVWEYSYNCITNQRWVFIHNKSIFNRRLKSKGLDRGVPKVKPTHFIVSKEINWHLITNKIQHKSISFFTAIQLSLKLIKKQMKFQSAIVFCWCQYKLQWFGN